MLTWLAPIIIVVVVVAAITAKLLVRRRAPEGGWFTDAPRSAGSLSVIGTMFAVMLAFVILFSLQSYQRAREGASVEAVAVTELSAVAGIFGSPTSDSLRGGLVCYGRAVVYDEWPAMQARPLQRLGGVLGRQDARRLRGGRPARGATGSGVRTVVRRGGAAPRWSA